jgi:hypothetical protein
MLELVDKLKKARLLAEQMDEGMLLYLLDMAILEARAKADTFDDDLCRSRDSQRIRAKQALFSH